MGRKTTLTRFSKALLILALLCAAASLARVAAQAQATAAISGNHPAVIPADWTPAPDTQQINLTAVLALRNTSQLAQLESDLQNRHSPNYHKWLTTDQFVAQFGPTSDQMSAVAAWLTQQGFNVTGTNQRTRRVFFTGTPGTIKQALATSIVTDGTSYANISDPMVPAELAPTIQAILGLSSLPQPSTTESAAARKNSKAALAALLSDEIVTYKGATKGPNFAPSDLYTFYNETPVLNGGNRGTGAPDCVGIPELGDVTTAAFNKFNAQFNLPPVVLKRILVNGTNPGLPCDYEPALDVEWVHAVSPNTPIYFYLANFNTTSTPYLDAITRAVDDNRCGAITSSVQDSCPNVPTIQVYNAEVEQGVVQGQTFFKSAGDYGDNWYCGNPSPMLVLPTAAPTPTVYDQSSCKKYIVPSSTGSQPSVDEEATSPFLTSVGGTQFSPAYVANFDASVVDGGLETTWNEGGSEGDHCPVKDSTGGGKSVVFAKPSWQTGLTADDGARDIPDIAMGANGDDQPGYFVFGKTAGSCPTPSNGVALVATGGTSIATPMWAAISRLIAQWQGVTRLGNINPRLYELGNLQSPGLHDITEGNNDDGNVPGYSAGPGYDQVTGWGTPNIALLVNTFSGAVLTTQQASVTVARGASAQASTFTIENTTADPSQLNGVTVAVTSPKLFSSLQASATANGVTQSVTVTPSKQTVLTFPSPLAIPGDNQTALVTLTITAAKKGGPSSLSLPSGSVSVIDDQGRIVIVGGVPTGLATVTVQ
ncbi:MAG: protease pro-enzyme activation domain-containing protein [Candidatus Binataceae bacterium]